MKMKFAALLFFLNCLISPAHLEAKGDLKQYVRRLTIGGSSGAIIIVGFTRDAKAIEQLLTLTVQEAEKTRTEIDWRNRESDVAKVNRAAGQTDVSVGPTALALFKAAKRIADWTGGAYDPSTGDGNYHAIVIDEAASTVRLKKKGMELRFDSIAEGFLADILVRHIYAAGMKNTMVRIGSAFRGLGRSIDGPWMLQIEDMEGTYAHRALNVHLANTGISAISATSFREKTIVDPRTRQVLPLCCRGVTVAMKEAALAQGMAHALLVLGPEQGMALMKKLGNVKGLIVDSSGKFYRSPGF